MSPGCPVLWMAIAMDVGWVELAQLGVRKIVRRSKALTFGLLALAAWRTPGFGRLSRGRRNCLDLWRPLGRDRPLGLGRLDPRHLLDDLPLEPRLQLPVSRSEMSPVLFDLLHPYVCFSRDMDIDKLLPLLARRREVDEHHETLLRVHRLRKLPHDKFQSMHLERCAHDEQHVGFLEQVVCLQIANGLAVRVWLVVQHDGRT